MPVMFATRLEPEACPYLGLPDDERTRFLFATPAHRCHVKRKPATIDLDHQGRYCLSTRFAACPRFKPRPVDAQDSAVGHTHQPVITVIETDRPMPTAATSGAPSAAVAQLLRTAEVERLDRSPVGDILKPAGDPQEGPASTSAMAPDDGPSEPSRSHTVGLVVVLLVLLIAATAVLLMLVRPVLPPGAAGAPRGAYPHHVEVSLGVENHI
jgi:hypothetical protein